MRLAVTGHRPQRLGGFDKQTFNNLVEFAKTTLAKLQPELVITGMALGWDQAVAQACVELEIPFHAYVPFKGQEGKWFHHNKVKYNELLLQAEKIVIVCEGGYHPDKLHKRNEAMVDNADALLAMFDGIPKGGTYRCYQYAKLKGVTVYNCFKSYAAAYMNP